MSSQRMSIGEAAERAGVKVPTIRWWEEIGLLAPPRTASGRRLYGPRELERLIFVRHARDLGFELEAIGALLSLQDDPGRSCGEADAIARAHLADVEARIAALQALKGELVRMIEGCAHGTVADCRIIEGLGDHGHCVGDHAGVKRGGFTDGATAGPAGGRRGGGVRARRG